MASHGLSVEKEVRANGDKHHQQIIILVCAFDFQDRIFYPGVSPWFEFHQITVPGSPASWRETV